MESTEPIKRPASQEPEGASPQAPKRPVRDEQSATPDRHISAETMDQALCPTHTTLHSLKTKIEKAASSSTYLSTGGYNSRKALLIYWEAADFEAKLEAESLKSTLERDYSFTAECFSIPREEPGQKLLDKLLEYRKNTGTDLVIIYYTGHGGQLTPDGELWWAAKGTGISLNWSALQKAVVECMVSDVVLIFDTCCAAQAARDGRPAMSGTKELIAACGWDAKTSPGYGDQSSFTLILRDELAKLSIEGKPFTICRLYTRLVQRKNGNGTKRLKATPVYCNLNGEHPHSQIVLFPVVAMEMSTSLDLESNHLTKPDIPEIPSYPKMIICVTLTEDLEGMSAHRIQHWLNKDLPKSLGNMIVTVDLAGVSSSTVAIMTIPVVVWLALSRDPAIHPCGLIMQADEAELSAAGEGADLKLPDRTLDGAYKGARPELQNGTSNDDEKEMKLDVQYRTSSDDDGGVNYNFQDATSGNDGERADSKLSDNDDKDF